MTIRLLPEFAVIFILVFARVGTLVMLMPGLGERSVPARVRLSLALLITLMIVPVVRPLIAVDPRALDQVLPVLFIELAVGFVLGFAMRLTLSALQTAGTIIAQQIGLSYSSMFDPTSGSQSTVIATFMVLMAVALIFATDTHHLAIRGLYGSYGVFPVGQLPPTGDAAELIVRMVAGAFTVALQMSAPFLVFGLVFNLGLGILSRLMPQMQIFFLALPATLIVGTLVLVATLAIIMAGYITYLQGVLAQLAPR
jgi:flagellar biosynthetic protein FliR